MTATATPTRFDYLTQTGSISLRTGGRRIHWHVAFATAVPLM